MKSFIIGDKHVNQVKIGLNEKLVFIGGPCAIESEKHALKMANSINKICKKLKIPWIYKSCFDKDCRSSEKSFTGIGINEGLEILSKIRKVVNIPVLTDFSVPSWAESVGQICDVIQVPAYLCRQTSILRAAAETKKPINLKKGQFMSPWNMKNSVRKIENFGNKKIILTDRGTFFGYNMLVNDLRSLKIMAETGYPVCYDATHSIQLPTSMGNISGGQREFIPSLVRACTASGLQAIFMEVHDNPTQAKSDPNTVLHIKYLERVLREALIMNDARKKIRETLGKEINIENG